MANRVKVGEKGFDSSFSHPPVARTVELGLTFRVGYISVPPAAPAKNITIQECIDTVNARQKLLLVWEMAANRATLGATYGAQDGRDAKRLAEDREQPYDVPILIADDTGTTVANLPKKIDYMYAAGDNAQPYDIGIYGGVKILKPLVGLWKIGWVPITAWSWSVSLAKLPNETTAAYNLRGRQAATDEAYAVGAHCLQYAGYYIDNVWAVDPNVAIADFPAWGLPDPQPPQESDMDVAFFEVEGLPGQYMWTPGSKPIPFTNPTDRDVLLKGLGVDPANGGKISQDMFQRLAPAAVIDADALAAKVAAAIKIPALTGHIAADLGAEGHITGSVG